MRYWNKIYKWILMIVGVKLALVILIPAEDSTNPGLDNRPQRCSAVKKLAFLKTHKCGSSTIENILFRYALKNQLNLVLPQTGNYLCKRELFNRSCLSSAPWKNLQFDMFALHTRWNAAEVKQLMGEDTFYFSVLRDPVDLFESMYSYMGLAKVYKRNLTEFIELVEQNSSDPLLGKRMNNLFGRNQIAFDWGISPDRFDDEDYINEQIVRLDGDFDLVLIVERMEESLVLLRHHLCWSVEDVGHLKINGRKKESTVKLNERQRLILRKWLRADYMIYEHFVDKFDNQSARQFEEGFLIGKLGSSRLKSEVNQLRRVNDKVRDQCGARPVDNKRLKGDFREWSQQILGYAVNESIADCRLYAMSEAAYLRKFREHLMNQLNNTATKS